jgi:hypothetical protein
MMDLAVYTVEGFLVLARAGLELWARVGGEEEIFSAHFLVDGQPEGLARDAVVRRELEQYWGNELRLRFDDDAPNLRLSLRLTPRAACALLPPAHAGPQ